MSPVTVLPFCGCQLGAGLTPLVKTGAMRLSTDSVGLNTATYTMSEVLQRLRYCRGEVEIPTWLRYYCNFPEDSELGPAGLKGIENADLILLEPNTTLDIFFGPYALHRSLLLTGILDKLQGITKEIDGAVNDWFYKGIWGRDRRIQKEAASILIPALQGRVDDEYLARKLLLEARGTEQDFDAYLASLEEVRDIVDLPIGLVTFIYEFLPDGRPMAWPADFLENTIEAAKRLGIPVFHSEELVTRYGVAVALDDNRRLYRAEFCPMVGEAILTFCRQVLDGSTTPIVMEQPPGFQG